MRTIGPDEPTFVIAEAGINHEGDLDNAKQLVRAAAARGADAIKFQLWEADSLYLAPEDIARLREFEFTEVEWRELAAVADDTDIEFIASVFSRDSLAFLVDELDAHRIKIASGDVTHLPLLGEVAKTDTSVIMSTGMATLAEVAQAVETLDGNDAPLHLLHCVSAYPADVSDLNLAAMATLRCSFDCSVGLSDHTVGTVAPVAAAALGATIVEKHFTLDTEQEGADHALSVDPDGLERLVNEIRAVEAGLGDGRVRPQLSERDSRQSMRRGLKARRDIDRGDQVNEADVKITRPATGLEPSDYDLILGRTARNPIPADEPITWDDL